MKHESGNVNNRSEIGFWCKKQKKIVEKNMYKVWKVHDIQMFHLIMNLTAFCYWYGCSSSLFGLGIQRQRQKHCAMPSLIILMVSDQKQKCFHYLDVRWLHTWLSFFFFKYNNFLIQYIMTLFCLIHFLDYFIKIFTLCLSLCCVTRICYFVHFWFNSLKLVLYSYR